MALIPCPECQREVSTAAAACPHCGYPLQVDAGGKSSGSEPVYIGFNEPKSGQHPVRRPQFDEDEYQSHGRYGHADRACTRCGQLCCSEHSTWFHPIKHAGLVCTSCASTHWIISLVGLIVIGGIILFVMMSNMR